jgi:DNA-binding ferritin-like protein
MLELATHLRYMQFYAHNAHNLCQGDTFFTDHEALGGLYGTYTELYDGVVERMIGLGQSVDLVKIQVEAAKMLGAEATPTSFSAAFTGLLSCEQELCKIISAANEGASLGTQDLLQAMCSESEVRQYKFQKRSSKSDTPKVAVAATPKEKVDEKLEVKESTDKIKDTPVKLLTSKN